MAAAPRDCPCFSARRYVTCCAPYHRGDREAATAEILMRSRYAAFARGLGGYLVGTLASEHPDRALQPEALARELGRMHERQRFLGLRILHAAESGDEAEVLFFARIFERGADCSFAELSRFVRESGAWRYASGLMVPRAELPTDPSILTPEDIRRSAR